MSNPLCVTTAGKRRNVLPQDAYLYSSTRFKTRSHKLLTPEVLAGIGDSGRIDDLLRLLSEQGIDIKADPDGRLFVEEALERHLQATFAEVEKCVPNPEWVALFRYPYDAHNIKSILKCRVRQKDPADLLVDLGTVTPAAAVEAIRTERYAVFSEAMAKAIPEAIAVYAKTADPQLIDAVIDSACFADQQAIADQYPPEYFGEIIACKTDMTNLLTAIRIGRMSDASVDYFSRHYIAGGRLTRDFFQKYFAAEEDVLLKSASKEGYPALEKLIGKSPRLSELERQVEATVSTAIRKAANMPAGLQVIYAYLADREKEAKNIRILLAAMQANRTPAEIRELLRA